MCLSQIFFMVIEIRKYFIVLFLLFLNDYLIANLINFMILNLLSGILEKNKKHFTNNYFLLWNFSKNAAFSRFIF